jgi:hypothetical protein
VTPPEIKSFCNDYESGRDGSMTILPAWRRWSGLPPLHRIGSEPNSMITAVFPASASAVAAAQHRSDFVSLKPAWTRLGSRSSRLSARISSRCMGWTPGEPFLARRTRVADPWIAQLATTSGRTDATRRRRRGDRIGVAASAFLLRCICRFLAALFCRANRAEQAIRGKPADICSLRGFRFLDPTVAARRSGRARGSLLTTRILR